MYTDDLNLFREAREATIGLTAGLTEQQSLWLPGPGKWSVGEVLDHILLAERLYRDRFTKLVELKKAGRKAELHSGFAEIDTSLLHIPKPVLPMLEMPFQMMNFFVPTAVREAMTRYRVIPAQAPSIATPRKGRPVNELCNELQSSVAQTEELFRNNPNLDYREMRMAHPLMGNNHVLRLLRIMTRHEQRHQEQIRSVQRMAAYPGGS